mmetsp:Transcript_8533/g.25678  ORF Transcript_8533/g.25678 Transcript_8533/m.25678 type:complete len:260 (-) Transcript_8533:52-831(-)
MVFESCFARKDQFMEGKALLEHEGIAAKLGTKLDAKNAISEDEALTKKLNHLIAAYETVVPGIEKALASEPAPEGPVVAGEVAPPAAAPPTREELLEKCVKAFEEAQGRAPTAEERAAMEKGIQIPDAEPVPDDQVPQGWEKRTKDDGTVVYYEEATKTEHSVADVHAAIAAAKKIQAGDFSDVAAAAAAEPGEEKKYVLSKYERIEFADMLHGHKARLDALKAAREAIKAAVVPKKFTTTPVEEDALTILSAKRLVGK